MTDFVFKSSFSFCYFPSQMGRFFRLVDTPEHKEEFKKRYWIPGNVSIEHCNLGEWHEKRPTELVAIPVIEFIKRWDEDSYGLGN